MNLTGITVDVPVSDLSASDAFYALVVGRPADRQRPGLAEWILHRGPEITLRLIEGFAVHPERCRVGLGVADVERERIRLEPITGSLEIDTRPGIIAELQLRDPDGYQVVLWQDLMSA